MPAVEDGHAQLSAIDEKAPPTRCPRSEADKPQVTPRGGASTAEQGDARQATWSRPLAGTPRTGSKVAATSPCWLWSSPRVSASRLTRMGHNVSTTR